MKKVMITVALLTILSATSCNYVEQSMRKDCGVCCGRSGYDYCYVTFVWENGEIIQSWYDNPLTLTDSIKQWRRDWGNYLIKTTK